jgi:beta-barrel assembly-enhancing protease
MKRMKMYYLKNSICFIAMFFILGLYSCDDISDPTSINIFSLQDDVNLGRQLDSQIVNSSGEYSLLNLPSAKTYVQNIINEIIVSPDVKYEKDFVYDIKIIHNDEVANAFAAPGGFIYVYTGLLKFVDNEATLAAVLAHEVAHCERRHATKRMTKQYGISFLLDLLLSDNPSQWEEIGSNLLTGLALLKNSRDDEYEADEYSFRYLQSTKWYPGGLIFFFDKIKDNEGSGFLEELLSTHPMPEDRVAAVEKMIEDANLPQPDESSLFTTEYQEFLKTLP